MEWVPAQSESVKHSSPLWMPFGMNMQSSTAPAVYLIAVLSASSKPSHGSALYFASIECATTSFDGVVAASQCNSPMVDRATVASSSLSLLSAFACKCSSVALANGFLATLQSYMPRASRSLSVNLLLSILMPPSTGFVILVPQYSIGLLTVR